MGVAGEAQRAERRERIATAVLAGFAASETVNIQYSSEGAVARALCWADDLIAALDGKADD